jgi:hypothetical protein
MSKRKSKRKKKTEKVLKDHKRNGKIFTPPIVTAFSNRLKLTKWSDDLLPNLVWIGLLFDALGEKKAVYVCENFVNTIRDILGEKDKRNLSFISEYSSIKNENIERLKESLSEKKLLNVLQKSLYPLVSLYGECPLKFLYDKNALEKFRIDIDKSLAIMKRVVKNILNKRSIEAMLVQTTAVYIMGITGKLKILKDQSLGNIETILDYPNTDESRKVAAGVRAALAGMRSLYDNKNAAKWCTYFWNHGYEISVCEIQKPLFTELSKKQKESLDKIYIIVREYQKKLFKEIEDLWWETKVNISSPIKDEVLGGLIARQARLATAIITNDYLWTLDLGRIIQRCMVDTHITLKWLIKEGKKEDYEKFIEYGLGQEKLLLEHLKIRLDESDPEFKEKSKEIEYRKGWIDSQLLTNFLPVNIGNWTTKNIRKMAKETDCIDIYNLSYAPFSNAVHGMWNTLARINLKFCINPLHKFHRIPSLEDPPVYFGIITQTAEIMDLSFLEWANFKSFKTKEQTSSANLRNEIKKILSKL